MYQAKKLEVISCTNILFLRNSDLSNSQIFLLLLKPYSNNIMPKENRYSSKLKFIHFHRFIDPNHVMQKSNTLILDVRLLFYIYKVFKLKLATLKPSQAKLAIIFTAWICASASSASSNDRIFCNPPAKISILSAKNIF